MPTLLFIYGFRFFFYSNENNEPIHIHIEKANANGKVWLEPNIEIAYMFGFSSKETKDIMEIIEVNYSQFKAKWNEHFNK